MKFSVIIPVYNKDNTIEEAVRSVLNQTCSDYEIIVIDDGSKIPVSTILSHIDDNRLVITRQQNGGVSSARNKGIALSQGQYICFLDADDIWYPNHLKEIERLLDKYGHIPMIITSHVEHLPDGRERHCGEILFDKEHDFQCDDLFELLTQYSGGIIHTNCICINKELFIQEGIQFEVGAIRGEDTDVWLRIALKHIIVISREETTLYRRELSTATKTTTFIYSWVFANRLDSILADNNINEKVKRSCIEYIDRYWMRCVRESKLDNADKAARTYLKKISNHRTKRYWITLVLAYLPDIIFRKAYRIIFRR